MRIPSVMCHGVSVVSVQYDNSGFKCFNKNSKCYVSQCHITLGNLIQHKNSKCQCWSNIRIPSVMSRCQCWAGSWRRQTPTEECDALASKNSQYKYKCNYKYKFMYKYKYNYKYMYKYKYKYRRPKTEESVALARKNLYSKLNFKLSSFGSNGLFVRILSEPNQPKAFFCLLFQTNLFAFLNHK